MLPALQEDERTVIYDRTEIEDGPLSESPLYKNVVREGVPL